MRIAFMHRRLAGGGTEADLRRMASGLAARGHALHVFAAKLDHAVDGAVLHRVPTLRGSRVTRLLSFAFAAPRMVARVPFDVVVGFGRTTRQDVVRVGGGTHRSYLAAMEASGRRGRARGPYHRALLWLEARMFAPRGHRRILAVSRRVADEVVRDYGVPPAHARVVYNGVDLERFDPARRAREGAVMRRALGVGDARVCTAIGTGFERKGFDLLLAAWRTQPPARTALVVVGDDERLGRWRREAGDPALDGRVHVLGPRADVDAILAATDVLCLPSRQEAFGNVVLEAAAAGVPVVTSAVVGAAELFEGSEAAVVVDDPGDARALSGAIERALSGWDARSAAARALAERHPWSRHLDELDAFLVEVARAG